MSDQPTPREIWAQERTQRGLKCVWHKSQVCFYMDTCPECRECYRKAQKEGK